MIQTFTGNHPTENEVERIRLILSTYQDGTGMLICKKPRGSELTSTNATTKPGWRDFERSVAAAFGGTAVESKALYDVIVPFEGTGLFFGISCKMRETLSHIDRDGRVTIEVSNAAGEFWKLLNQYGILPQNLHEHSTEAGRAVIERVEEWNARVDYRNSGNVITEKSFMLALQYSNRTGFYQLFQFPMQLPDPSELAWRLVSRRLIGVLNSQVIIEWYSESGGQLKYYPHKDDAIWSSSRFRLEPLPANIEAGLGKKAAAYYPALWNATLE